MATPDFLIIGSGVIGCTLARELARVSRDVLVVDRGPAGGAASPRAAGLLVPAFGEASVGPLIDLCFQSAARYESWVGELREEGAGDVGFRRSGLLEVCTDPAREGPMRQGLAQVARSGRRAEWLAGAELRRREPALALDVAGAVGYPDDAQVDPALLAREVARVAERAGVQVRENEPVVRLVRAGDRIGTVETTGGKYHPGTVVLTAGAWSGGLAAGLGLHLPTRPVKGQLLLAECRVAPLQTPLQAGPALLLPRADGRLLLGVTVEEAGFDERVTLDGLRTVLQQTCAVVPAVGQLSLARAWAGLRPATPDGWPFMGPLPPFHNFWVSAGHFRKGILLAPLVARLMAQSILAGHPVEDLEPFKPTRHLAG